MKKKWLWYPVSNIKNRFLFGTYGRNVYIEPGVVIKIVKGLSMWEIT